MNIAIMQPYFFPYIGYWQLIHAVDRFVIYDDVNYIKGGWVNRNRILINGEPAFITVPLQKLSQNKRICDLQMQPLSIWREKLVKMVGNTYRQFPYFNDIFPVIERTLRYDTDNLSDYLVYQLQSLSMSMDITTEFIVTSRCYENSNMKGQERILDICKREGATGYINPQGGRALYDTEIFRNACVDLRFIIMRSMPYKQRRIEFMPYLSIIDVLMAVGPEAIKDHLEAFDLIAGEKN